MYAFSSIYIYIMIMSNLYCRQLLHAEKIIHQEKKEKKKKINKAIT